MAANKSTPNINASSAVPGSSFSQRTFLGSSISKFSLSAGFGDTTSTLGVDLVNDEFNVADKTTLGQGQDPYHNGIADNFTPPPVGSPVFFNMGPAYIDNKNLFSTVYPTVEQSFTKTLDDIYGTSTISSTDTGYWDLAFGGILQTYNQTRSNSGNPLFSVQVVDPREVLSNVELVLRNYAGTTFNNQNMFNLYGFLEYNGIAVDLDGWEEDILTRKKETNAEGNIETVYSGTDMRYIGDKPTYADTVRWQGNSGELRMFPITGTGFSRVGPQGIPYYRVTQAMYALSGLYGPVPKQYQDAGFGGVINFRGFNYVVDLQGVPNIDQFYYIDYDRISLLDFCQELCEITSSELFVSLLPIIDHPATESLYLQNSATQDPARMVHGIIRVDAINRKQAQTPNAIRSYIENNLYGQATRTDVGIELTNVTTDKFISGAQEVTNTLFSTANDRKDEDFAEQWKLKYALSQQVLPYYGTLRSGAVTIPKGYGAYQQILLDASDLNAFGVGDYYVTTEIELRAASVSFESWVDFLLGYNELYMESTEEDDLVEGARLERTPNVDGLEGVKISNNYAVTVPRNTWPNENTDFGENGLPKDVCHPPYGYPLYYKRATGIGVNLSGLANMGNAFNSITSSIATISGATGEEFATAIRQAWQEIKDASKEWNQETTQAEREYFTILENLMEDIFSDPLAEYNREDVIGLLQSFGSKLKRPQKIKGKLAKKSTENAQRIYKFLKDIAQKNLGKRFLVKLPKAVNWNFQAELDWFGPFGSEGPPEYGPFGFKPRPLNNDPREEAPSQASDSMFESLTDDSTASIAAGALVTNFNPITNEIIASYQPNNNGGWFDFEIENKLEEQAFKPVDMIPITRNNGRISCYVRFNNSQNLSFDRISRDKFTQQTVEEGQWVPDANYQLDNTSSDKSLDLTPDDPEANGPQQVAFVKAEVDSKLYFAPTQTSKTFNVYGQEVHDIGRWSEPKRIWNCEDGKMYNSIPYLVSDLRPTEAAGEVVSVLTIKDGRPDDLTELADEDSVYALVTIPNKIEPTVDERLRDGPFQVYNAAQVKHFMGQDVVAGLPGFDKPGFRANPATIESIEGADPLPLTARRAVDKARSGATFSKANELSFVAPSPVYPDLICIPLESTERSYGPWVSSLQNDSYQNVGGDIKYEKDESLAPWNYAGYHLMNKAALVKTEYSNSLLLQSERGSFSIPSAPSGIALGRYLLNNGPLVTNINVSIGNGGIETSYVMDMYTSSYGKLQKQKSDNIAKIARNNQKLIDQKNLSMRRGFQKDQIDSDMAETQENIRNFSPADQGVDLTPGYTNTGDQSIDTTVLTVTERRELAAEMDGDAGTGGGEVADSTYRSYITTGTMSNNASFGDTASIMPDETQAQDYANSANDDLDDRQVASSTPRGDAISPTKNKAQAMDNLYDDDIEPTASWG